jgi:hypothetical protein
MAAVMAALAGSPIAGPARAASATPSALSGFTTGFADIAFESPTTGTVWLHRAVGAGARLVLLQVEWNMISPLPPAPGTDPTNPANPAYSWGTLDNTVRAATADGLTVAFTIAGAGAPAWADGPNRPRSAAPGTWRPSAAAFAAFATAVARRYSGTFNPGGGVLPRVKYYQAWSEPNLPNHLAPQWVRSGRHWVAESPIIYRGLLNAFYAGVKSINRSNVVITGGTAPFGDQPGGSRVPPALFVRDLLCVSGALRPLPCPHPAHFDILAHHPYELGGPFQAALQPDDVSLPDFAKLTRPLAVAERTGRALPRGRKPIWVTEFSWDSKPPDPGAIPVMERARWTEEAFYELWREGVSAIAWYLIVDQPPIPNYASTYQSGLYYLDGRRKPGFEAFRFPFVVEHNGRTTVVWGITPDAGTVLVQRREAGRWITVLRFRRRAHAIFTRPIAPVPGALMRARVGSETSMPWSAP